MQLPKSTFIPHPEGNFSGNIIAIEDLGEVQTAFGPKLKVAIKIASHQAAMEDGQPFLAIKRCNQSTSRRAELTKFREMLAGRRMTDDELEFFEDAEVVGKQVGYTIIHNHVDDNVYANIENVWPMPSAQPPPVPPEDAQPQTYVDKGPDPEDDEPMVYTQPPVVPPPSQESEDGLPF